MLIRTRLSFAFLLCFAVISSPYAHAQYSADVALKVDYFHFNDSVIKRLNSEDGVYVGLEVYKQLFCPNLYFGAAIGWAGPSGSVSEVVTGPAFLPTFISADSSIDYVPIELNVKYVLPITHCFNFAFGGGGSLNFFSFSSNVTSGRITQQLSDSDWVWGGQIFGELNYNISNWFIGIDAKYQLTEDLKLFGVDTQGGADNIRAGGRVGFRF